MNTKRFPRGLYAPEALESRIAPATIIVTSLLDDNGAGTTLREAIVQANGTAAPDTIKFDPTVFVPGSTIVLNGTEIDITSTLTIQGPGVDRLTISGNNASRIFDIADSDPAVLRPTAISGLMLLDGNAPGSGGAILSTESLAMSNVVIASSVASSRGGAVDVETAGKVSIVNCRITGNQTTGAAGGGVYAEAALGIVVSKTLVSGNSTTSNAGGMYLRTENAAIVVDGCSFLDNTASGSGGGLLIQTNVGGKAIVKRSTFTGNTAGSNGGGLYLEDGNLTVDRCVFAHNSATVAGGAIADNSGDSVAIKNSRFDGNTAVAEGGALYLDGTHAASITSCIFTGNRSTSDGGAIQAETGIDLTIRSSTFAGNTATGNGGGISVEAAGTELLLVSSVLSGNTGMNGGGVFATLGAKVTVSGGSFLGNFASDDGGGLATTGAGANAVALSVTGTLFQGNRADTNGAGISTAGDGTVLIKGARVLGNFSDHNGGGMYLRTATSVIIQNTLFQHNVASSDGGGVAFRLNLATAVGTVTGCKFLDNSGGSGGGIFSSGIAGAALTISSSLISGNVAAVQGGGLRIAPAATVIRIHTVIAGNWAPAGPNIFP
jgi:predicted outer membrane repeat protein